MSPSLGFLFSPGRTPPSQARAARALDVGLCTFAILALELGLIRWFGGQIRLVAYFANLVLLAAFLGMGLGIALGRRRPRLIHAALPAIAALAAVLAFAAPLRLMQVRFPDLSIFLWATDAAPTTLLRFLAVTTLMAAIFWAVAGVFTLVAAPLGPLFDRLPALRAYTADIVGSLAGIVAVTLISAAGASPWQWIALGVLPILWFSRTPLSIAAAIAAVALAAYSGRSAFFSPYNRIDLVASGAPISAEDPLRRNWVMHVNRDYHQRVSDLSNRSVASQTTRGAASSLGRLQAVYEMPFRLRPDGRAGLVIGAGTGNDVAGALRAGYAAITAVEIDPTILQLGRLIHPEDPYGDARVRTVNDDARAYFERTEDTFDVVSYGLVDSHAMFSAMSSLRLDNFIYTREGIAAGWRRVNEGGVLAISFSTFAGPWIEQRLLRTIRDATGITPLVVRHGMDYGTSFLVARSIDPTLVPAVLQPYMELRPVIDESVRVPTDDWPFLYIRPKTVPFGYLAVLLIIAVTATLAVRRVYAPGGATADRPRFDWGMFLMGAGFMLLETRMVTELSLLFGSTWIVNASVFGGVLVMILLANAWVERRRPVALGRWFLPLLLSIVVTWAVGAGVLNQFGITARSLLGGIMFALPIGCAGVIVATLLARSKSPATALGANLLGAVLGGILEYSSMFLGLTFVALLAFACYVGAFVAMRGRLAQGSGASSPDSSALSAIAFNRAS